jgi:hypothetical protein
MMATPQASSAHIFRNFLIFLFGIEMAPMSVSLLIEELRTRSRSSGSEVQGILPLRFGRAVVCGPGAGNLFEIDQTPTRTYTIATKL